MKKIPSAEKSSAKTCLARSKDEIVSEWEKRVRQTFHGSDHPKRLFLQDDLPEFIDRLTAAFSIEEQDADPPKDTRVREKNPADRNGSFNYTLEEVLKEYEILHDVIIDVLDQEGEALGKTEMRVIRTFIHRAIQAAAATFSDIKHTMELSKERDFLSAILDNLAEGVVACDRNGVLVLFNRASREIHGLPEVPIPADEWADHYNLYHADGRTLLRKEEIPLFRAFQGEIVRDAEIIIAPRGAPVRTVLGSGRALRDRDGSVAGAVVAMYDVTSFKAAEEARASLTLEQALRLAAERSERATAQILERISDAFFAVDAEWRFTYVNNQAEKLFGKRCSELLGKNLWGEISDALGDEVQREYKRAVEQQCVVSFEVYYPQLEGWFRVKAYPSADGLSVYLENVSEIHRAREELELARMRAENATKAKSAFLANMSHEIRTPLGVILGFSEFILDPNQTVSDRYECITTIRRNAEQLARLINELLDLSKIEADRLEIEKVRFKLDDVIQDVYKLLNFHAREKGIGLSFLLGKSVPQYVTTDPMRLRQILINVIGNAIKFTERGSVDVDISMDSGSDESAPICLQFAVRDTGIGLTMEQAQRIWEPFVQADSTTTRKFGGTGLGLSLSRKLACTLGGDLVLTTSEIGKGSVFTITIEAGPLEAETAPANDGDAPALAPRDMKPSEDSKALNGAHILLVEDSFDNQILVKRILSREGASVEIAADGEEGVAKAMTGEYDLVLMDVQMPKLDGYEATVQLRDRGFRVPIIALTAHAMKGERERAIIHGCDDHLTKPIDRKMLLDKVLSYWQTLEKV